MKKRYLNIALACVGYRCLDACEEALETVSYHIDTILSDDKDLSNKVEALNKYIGASITYDMANGKEVCDASVYNKWLEYNGKEVTINSSKVDS